MKRFEGRMERKENRDDYHEMIRTKNLLKEKQRSIQRAEDDEYGSESEYDDESDQSEGQMKQKAIDKIKKELDESDDASEDDDSAASDSSDSSTKIIQMDFSKAKENAKKNSKTKASSLQNMAFMKNADEKKKQVLKEQANDLIKQIEEEEALRNSDNDDSSEDGGGIFNASKKLKKDGKSSKTLID